MREKIERGAWSSGLGFVLAAAGSAIGLGNIWKFPFKAGVYGGAAFVFVYLFCVAAIGLPLMLAEFAVGRAAQRDPVGAYAHIKPNSRWYLVGMLGVAAGFLILSYYSVVAGWVLGYLVEAVSGGLSKLDSAEAVAGHFQAFQGQSLKVVGYHGLFLLLSVLIVVRGVKGGIERFSKVLMPVLLGLLVVLMVRALTLPGAEEGVAFLMKPDFSKINSQALVVALGHAFFTLSLGMGAMITYGSYLPKRFNLARSALTVAGLDTVIALMAGFAIFPAVFAFKLDAAEGPGLLFVTLPNVFRELPAGGMFFASLFFFLVAIAALTSGISLLEVVCAYFIDSRGWSRTAAAWIFGGVIFLIGVPSALNAKLFGVSFFDIMDHLTSDYMLPLGGLCISLFVGYAWGVDGGAAEVRHGNPRFVTAPLWGILLRYLAPFVMIQILVFNALDQLKGVSESLARLLAWTEPAQKALAWVDAGLIALFVVYAIVVLVQARSSNAD